MAVDFLGLDNAGLEEAVQLEVLTEIKYGNH